LGKRRERYGSGGLRKVFFGGQLCGGGEKVQRIPGGKKKKLYTSMVSKGVLREFSSEQIGGTVWENRK